MHKKNCIWMIAIGFFVAAGAILAQNADPNTAAPTKNDLRLRVAEPAEGSTLTGTSLRVVVDYNRPIFGSGQGTRFGEASFPPAKFDVFIDGKVQQTLTTGESNVANIENVAPGAHKLAVVAKNLSGEVIDRKEINFQTVAEPASISTSAPPAPAAAPEPATPSTPPPPSSSVTQQPEAAPPAPATLPQTGSDAPRMALAGLALAVSGLVVSRKAR